MPVKIAGFGPEVEREFVSVAEAEALTGVSRWTWRVYAYKGRVSSVKVGKRLLLPVCEVRRILSEGTRPRVDGLPAGASSKNVRHRDQRVTSGETAEPGK
jgi:hypothetical protein